MVPANEKDLCFALITWDSLDCISNMNIMFLVALVCLRVCNISHKSYDQIAIKFYGTVWVAKRNNWSLNFDFDQDHDPALVEVCTLWMHGIQCQCIFGGEGASWMLTLQNAWPGNMEVMSYLVRALLSLSDLGFFFFFFNWLAYTSPVVHVALCNLIVSWMYSSVNLS